MRKGESAIMAASPAANPIGKSPHPVSPSKFKKVALAAHAAMGGNGLSSSFGFTSALLSPVFHRAGAFSLSNAQAVL